MIASLEISLRAIEANANVLRAFIAPSRAAFVVKSNAYGHGLLPVARTVEPLSEALCVFSPEEAFTLRAGGVRGRIIVMGPIDPHDLQRTIGERIEFALWDTGGYLHVVERAANANNAHARVHVKINTGVARLGLNAPDAAAAIRRYAASSAIEIAGIFSHLAAAEELDSPFTHEQLRTFETVLAQSAAPFENGSKLQRHIAASAAALLWPETRFDFARIGIALYGLWPSPQTRAAMKDAALDLQPALTFQSTLAAVRSVAAGSSVGYGCSYHAERDTRIGVVPVGYADGIPRLLSNRGSFLVRGKRCPVAGRICMNMAMVDLGAVPDAEPGDTVTLIGEDGGERITADDWALWAETINYEIVARLPEHLPRVFR